VRKDGGEFDQFTGATITPRAVVRATARALAYAEANRSLLFKDAATLEGGATVEGP
jgi:electron transport complex protein RnfG